MSETGDYYVSCPARGYRSFDPLHLVLLITSASSLSLFPLIRLSSVDTPPGNVSFLHDGLGSTKKELRKCGEEEGTRLGYPIYSFPHSLFRPSSHKKKLPDHPTVRPSLPLAPFVFLYFRLTNSLSVNDARHWHGFEIS
jgi:hypothetical protein